MGLTERVVNMYRKPDGRTYAEHVAYGATDRITPAMDPEIAVALGLVSS